MPLAAVNFAFDKAREYFSTRFKGEFFEKFKDVPDDQIIEPKASVAGPALQGLAFSHEEVDLMDLYLSLLASAMDARISPGIHPAFVEIIRQLSAEEARLLRRVFQLKGSLPIAEVRVTIQTTGWRVLHRHLLPIIDTETREPIENPRTPAIVENWIRLGLVIIEYDKIVSGEEAYNWVEKRPEVVRLRGKHDTAETTVIVQKGVLTPTSLGREFAIAVGILDAGEVAALD